MAHPPRNRNHYFVIDQFAAHALAPLKFIGGLGEPPAPSRDATIAFRYLKQGLKLEVSTYGDTWEHRTIARAAVDWGKLYGGPSMTKGDAARVLYFSAPLPISTRFFPVLFPKYQRVYRSYDNGETWSDCSRISLKPRQHGLDPREWVIFGSGVVAEDGTVFLGFRRGPRLGIAISRDDAETWQIHDIPGAELLSYHNILQVGLVNPNYMIGEPLALDERNNLYALWPDASDRLRLAWSPDHGAT
jgi:hypothetical protein